MKLFERLFRARGDDRAGERPLWHAVVAAARRPRWYRELGVADSVAGRFDMVSVILAMVLLRLECERAIGTTVHLTELFVEDMDGQLRQSGVGDLVVGKHVGKLVSVLGGRLGALRLTLSLSDDHALAEVIRRNLTMADPTRAEALAAEVRTLGHQLEALSVERLLAGELPGGELPGGEVASGGAG